VSTLASASDRFATTRWSVVRSCSDSNGSRNPLARQALGQLCQIYWRPIFAYICLRGYSPEDAEDLTQDFFAAVLEGSLLERADPGRGRFRSLLLRALGNFLNDATDRRRSRKRGGDIKFISWDDWVAESPSQMSIPEQALQSWSPEQLFDLRWAATVVERALRRLQEECKSKGRSRLCETLSPYLATERSDVSYGKLSGLLGISEAGVKRQLHNLRRRYRWLIWAEVAETVEDPGEVKSEIRHLCATLTAQAASIE
jgi:RNA polymerase sigma factor (sigma-70 family)